MLVTLIGVVLLILILFKIYLKFTTGSCTNNVSMDSKTVLITGADKGIGYETTFEMARRGARVIMACRDIENAKKVSSNIKIHTGNENVIVMKLDLSHLDNVRKFVSEFTAKESKLDVLINNAGMPSDGTKLDKGIYKIFLVNYLSHFLLTHLLKDLLLKQPSSRVINVASYASLSTFSINPSKLNTGSYSITKTLQILHAMELHRQFSDKGMIACSLHPGLIWNKNFFSKALFPVSLLSKISYPFMKNSREGAQTTIHLATDENIKGGVFYADCKPSFLKPPCLSDELARKVYEASETLCQP